jgi:hypothetical protein
MANLPVKDQAAATKYLKTSGAGTDGDPHIPEHLETNSAAILTALQIIDNIVSGSEAQVDVVASLPAGTNAIGKLAANSGVDIGDVDVLSSALPSGAATEATLAALEETVEPVKASTDITVTADLQVAGEVLFDTTAVALAKAVSEVGELISINLVFLTDQAFDFDLYVLNTSTTIGAAGGAPTITAANLQPLIVADWKVKSGAFTNPVTGLYSVTLPLMGLPYVAKTAEQNIHLAAVTRSATTPTDTTVKSTVFGK